MNRKPLLAVLLTLLLSSCISVPKATGTFPSNLEKTHAARLLYENAKRCWYKEDSFWVTGIDVTNRIELDGVVITAWITQHNRNNFPLAVILVADSPTGSSVRVSEAPMTDKNFNLTSDIPRWLSGDLSCRPLD